MKKKKFKNSHVPTYFYFISYSQPAFLLSFPLRYYPTNIQVFIIPKAYFSRVHVRELSAIVSTIIFFFFGIRMRADRGLYETGVPELRSGRAYSC